MKEHADPPSIDLPKEAAKLTDEERHKFLGYLIPQLEPLRASCEHNWLIQAVLITVAVFNLIRPEQVAGIAETIKVPVASLNLVVPVVLTYLLIRFGYLLNAYMFIREGIADMLKGFTVRPPEFEEAEAERMLRANSLVELLYLNFDLKGWKDFKVWKVKVWEDLKVWKGLKVWKDLKKLLSKAALPLLGFMLTLVFALNHVLVLLYLGRLVGSRKRSLFIGLIIIGILSACYMQFNATTKRRGARVISKGAVWLTPPLFLLVHWKVYGSLW